MKTIYKSIALEAALLSVTLALQAEIQSEGETVTADVQASTLDRLKVTLVSPNVSGARDLVASGNATIDGNEIAVSLENLAFGTHRLVVSARFGTQIRTLYALDISVPQAELPNETQEYEDVAIVVSTYGDGGGGEFPTDYAKQGDDPTATLTDTQAYAQAAAEDAAAAKVAAQSLTSLDSDINAGKSAIAVAVSGKGVPTSSDDTMLQMATNIQQIAQSPIIIDGGEMYVKQLFGSLTTPNYWNLYDVMAQLLSDGRLLNYGGILLAEYYKGYDSIALSGAGAGGAYVVSDTDANGNFIVYTEDTTHVWSTEDDGKGDRWAAYCFASAWHDFDITNTNTSPRKIFIGRNVGTIRQLASSRTADVVVLDGNKLKGFNLNSYSANFKSNLVLRNLEQIYTIITASSAIESLYVMADTYTNEIVSSSNGNAYISSLILECKKIPSGNRNLFGGSSTFNSLAYVAVCGVEECDGVLWFCNNSNRNYIRANALKSLVLYEIEQLTFNLIIGDVSRDLVNMKSVYLSHKTNDKTKSVVFVGGGNSIDDLILGNYWCKPLTCNGMTGLTEANMYAHILQRLKQDEPDCGDGVTITLGSTNLDKLTSAESIALIDDLTNIYGYTFA